MKRDEAIRAIIKTFSDFRSEVQDNALHLTGADRERAHDLVKSAAVLVAEFECSL